MTDDEKTEVFVRRLRLIQHALMAAQARTDRAGLDDEMLLLPDGTPVLFDLSNWTAAIDIDDAHECGTSACAIGFAMQCPEVQAEGLSATATGGPYFEGAQGWCAVKQFLPCEHLDLGSVLTKFLPWEHLGFGSDLPAADLTEWLFDEGHYVDPTVGDVIERIGDVLFELTGVN